MKVRRKGKNRTRENRRYWKEKKEKTRGNGNFLQDRQEAGEVKGTGRRVGGKRREREGW